MKYPVVIFSFLFVLTSFKGIGQCCSAGNPVGGDGSNDGLGKNDLRIFASYKYSLSRDYFHYDDKIDVPNMEKSYFDFNMISVVYGLLPRISLYSDLGYFIDKVQEVKINNEKEIIKSHGLGDLGFNVRYIAMKTVKPVSQLVFSGGIKIPIGAFNEEMDGITIPISLQPSSGAFKYNASVFYSRKYANRKFGWNSLVLFETSNTINKGFLVYKYGNFCQLSFAGSYHVIENLILTGNLKYEWRGHDKRESNIKIESTGSSVFYVNPQLIYNLRHKWAILLMTDIPVYKYVNGYQLTNKFSFQFGLRRSLSFSK